MRIFRSNFLALMGLSITLGLGACSGDEMPETSSETAVAVTTAEARLSRVPQVFTYSGTVQGTQSVRLSTRMTGQIQYLRVAEGDRVTTGQVLVRVERGNVDAQRDQVLAGLREMRAVQENARIQLERVESLYDTDSATLKELEDARTKSETVAAQIAGLEGRLREVEDALGDLVLSSPIDGFIVRKYSDEGDLASPGQALLEIEDTGSLEVVADIPESDIERFAVGDTLHVEIESSSSEFLSGRVTQINPASQTAGRQFSVTLALEQGQTKGVWSGMYARVILESGGREAIVVPREAVITRGQLSGLFTVDSNERALLRWVRTGKQFSDHIEIVSGLSDGERYVASHKGRLVDAQLVRAN